MNVHAYKYVYCTRICMHAVMYVHVYMTLDCLNRSCLIIVHYLVPPGNGVMLQKNVINLSFIDELAPITKRQTCLWYQVVEGEQ